MAADLPTRETKRDREEQQHSDRLEDGAAGLDPIDLLALSQDLRIIPIPEDGDDLETTAQKMEDLAKVVRGGNSLALYTGLKLAPPQPQNPEEIVVAEMSLQERTMYNAWKRSRESDQSSRDPSTVYVPRPFDWDANVAPAPTGAHSRKKFAERAAAMDLIWGHEGATPEHASWLTFHRTGLLPLVNAIAKVTRRTKHMKDHGPKSQGGLSDMEAAELETIRQTITVAERNRSRELERIRTMTRTIAESVTILKSRVHDLERGTSE
ncbi:hypothetical protein P168DRAFT_317449 [Aspergillus campestris IBT 28561]|uniref:Uncharacterized protein n=1 Tax=Aspergillus campestris (strain IBT 28561) TaxID=1392248 RepID=A0A2I1D7T8_ASPC2|nr:uncharacterized protein P168DRAFT_317449 [Aspergillus campestris IBT 28561]PKY05944.1 hypothetical protein P168DRAFT_317449 [Aspergillus campestris IBT 28561]